MNPLLLFLSLFVASAEVLQLNVGNFKDTVLSLEQGNGLFVKFYAPWCGHCKKLAPAWEDLSKEFEGTNQVIAEIDASEDENRIVGKYFGVRGFPTLKYFRDGKVFDYSGPRDAAGLANWIKDENFLKPEVFEMAESVTEQTFVLTTTTTTTVNVVNPVIELNDSSFEHQTQSATGATTGSWFVKFYTPWCGHCKRLAPEWQKLANMVDINTSDLMIAEVDLQKNTNLQTRFQIKGYPSIMLFSKGNLYEYSGARTAEAMLSWYSSEAYLTAKSRPVPAELSVFGKYLLQASDLASEIAKLYSTIFTRESLWVMYNNQPILAVAGGLIIAMTTFLIIYQIWTVLFGVITGTVVEEKIKKTE